MKLLGYRSDVARLLSIADVFAFPSHYEGHPGAIVEAMFARKAIVASDIPVHRETLENGVSGVLVPLQDEKRLAKAILDVLANPTMAEEMGASARVTAEMRYDAARAAMRHEQLFVRILDRAKRN